VTVLDKDLLSADDMICAFGPVQLAELPPPEARLGRGSFFLSLCLPILVYT
jgi:hypothetical protein